MSSEKYRDQVRLLLQVMNCFGGTTDFALKGGTAINLFLREDFPRLSVDIDLIYLHGERFDEAKVAINEVLDGFEPAIRQIAGFRQYSRTKPDGFTRLITTLAARVKIEVSPIVRGSVYQPSIRAVSDAVADEFGYAEMLVGSIDDVYAGKLVAAMDRQHPRDLFDVRNLLDNEGITPSMIKAFAVYLCSSNAAMSEVLTPRRKELAQVYEAQFEGMVNPDSGMTLDVLIRTREEMIERIHTMLGDAERAFIMSVQRKAPDWELLKIPGLTDLPSVRFKVQNLGQMSDQKYEEECRRLESILYP